MSEIDHVGLWNRCLEIIRDNVPEQTYKTWFLPIIPLKYEDITLVVQVPSQFFYEFLEDKFVDLLRKTLYKVIGEGTKLMYNVMVDKSSRKTVDLESTQRTIIPQKQVMDKRIPQIPVPELDPHLNPEYNFETFIEGYSNKLSRSVAEAVALNPAKTIFNPLFLYGASGVGKTHLANAIGTKIKELYPEKRVLYVSAHLFQVQYTDSVRNNTTNDFINFYQTIDILIIDDIQDSGFFKKLLCRIIKPFFSHQRKKAADKYPDMNKAVSDMMKMQYDAEHSEKPSVDMSAHPTALMLAAVLSAEAHDEIQKRVLYEFGYHIGRWIYLVDAADDIEKDIKSNGFNPFVNKKTGEVKSSDFIKAVLNQSLARAYDAYNLLNFTDFKGILDNMMLLGFPASQNRVTSKLDTEVNNE